MIKKLLFAAALAVTGMSVQAAQTEVEIYVPEAPVTFETWDSPFASIPGSVFAEAKAGDVVRLYVTDVASDAQIQIACDPGWILLEDYVNIGGKTYYDQVLEASTISILQGNNGALCFKGHGYTFTKAGLLTSDNEGGEGGDEGNDGEIYSGVLFSDLGLTLTWDAVEIKINQTVSEGDIITISGTSNGGTPQLTFAWKTVGDHEWTEILTAEDGTYFEVEVPSTQAADGINQLGFFVMGQDFTINTISYKGVNEVVPGGTIDGQSPDDEDFEYVESEPVDADYTFQNWEDTDPYTIEASFFADATAEDQLHIYYKANSNDAQIQLAYTSLAGEWTETVPYQDIAGEGYVSQDLTDILADVQENGFKVNGRYFTLVKYALASPDQEASVNAIEVNEEAPVIYFNLQGVRVAEPANGIFIRVQGQNVSKVIVK